MVKYKNRYGDIFTFELKENGNIIWNGNFKFSRAGINEDKTYMFIDPSGGPYLSQESNMGLIDESFNGMIIDSFIDNVGDTFEIVIKQ